MDNFLETYREALREALHAQTGIRPALSAIIACESGLELTAEHDKDAFAREADRLCGTMGFDRDAAERAQEEAFAAAEKASGNGTA